MSRKRKRRGRGPASEADMLQQDNQADDIEIVDDVNILDAPVTVSTAEASAEPVGSPRAKAADTDAGADSADADVDGDAPVSSTPPSVGSVHVVESLHESPVTEVEGDRTVETLGELLQHAREAKGLSLEEVSARTRIALLTLRHLENDRFGELPAEAYVKGFLRSYGSFLSLDVSMLLRRYEKLSGRVSTPVAEIWDEVEVNQSRLNLWRPSRRTMAVGGAVLVVAALAWVFWSQGAVMLGLRPEGELQQIEMQLQREALESGKPQTAITGLDDAALQQEPETSTKAADKKGGAVGLANPPSTAGPSTVSPSTTSGTVSIEDASPPVPQPPLKPAPTVGPKPKPKPEATAKKPVVTEPVRATVQKPEPTEAEKKAAAAAKKPVKKPVRKPAPKKPVKKPAPAPSPEDAAGPPA